jgi:hypothetical protein
MHSDWNSRPLDDKIRESVILLVLVLLYIPAYRKRSFLLFLFPTIAILQHLNLLIYGSDLVPSQYINIGVWFFAAAGFYHMDIASSFAGTYSTVSKFNVNKILPSTWPIDHLELNKLIVGSVVWTVVYLLLSQLIKRRTRYEKVKDNIS